MKISLNSWWILRSTFAKLLDDFANREGQHPGPFGLCRCEFTSSRAGLASSTPGRPPRSIFQMSSSALLSSVFTCLPCLRPWALGNWCQNLQSLVQSLRHTAGRPSPSPTRTNCPSSHWFWFGPFPSNKSVLLGTAMCPFLPAPWTRSGRAGSPGQWAQSGVPPPSLSWWEAVHSGDTLAGARGRRLWSKALGTVPGWVQRWQDTHLLMARLLHL